MMWNPIKCVSTTIDYLYSLSIRVKNWYQYTFTTKKRREKIRPDHCLRFCFTPEMEHRCSECSGRHIYNQRTIKYEKDLLYFCVDCPYRKIKEREEYW